ncbi:ArsR family transcriptional regulator [Candidatus Nitrosopumilus koreensis AR1]|uniref:ArsR family transcriptional regulator n=1 Tax=Candidatus Nitrosopumilus koreensis AR1 TaxID=1229908 RepID=K0B7E1_9ARCH|nr:MULTISPECIES: helix-turn-helix domain-containing protein [Nitrosopumilus]AFS80371.1 ArsR family transcriptional regulator [Candidatus Nitrosopumilus koreensis AR1]
MVSGAELILELSSSQRMDILQLLSATNLKASEIAKKLNTSIQAISRHVDRLHAAKLIEKNEDGIYKLTVIGNALLHQYPFFEFLGKYRDYFETHDFSGVPDHLLVRIGDLLNCDLETNTMKALQRSRDWAASMEKWVKGVTFTIPLEYYETVSKSMRNGATHKIVFGKNSVVPNGYYDHPRRKEWEQYIESGQIQEKIVESVPLVVGLSEKEAHLIFANKKLGYPDIKGIFFSKDPKFRKWCEDLVDYYWTLPEIKNFKLVEK